MKAVIGGTTFVNSETFNGWEELSVQTPFGKVQLKKSGDIFFLQRHGDRHLPPHSINHRANIRSLAECGVTGIIAVNSVGSLKEELTPGTYLVPHDFISLWDIPTYFDTEARYLVPVMDSPAREGLLALCNALGLSVAAQGVYIQTRGPRFETRAEIELLRRFGEVVGMTMASEATLAMECGIPYASLCSIDNFCHGIATTPLSLDDIMKNARNTASTMESLVRILLSGDVP